MALMYPLRYRCYRSSLFRGLYARIYTYTRIHVQTNAYIHRHTVVEWNPSECTSYIHIYNVVELYQHLLWKSFSSWFAKRERETRWYCKQPWEVLWKIADVPTTNYIWISREVKILRWRMMSVERWMSWKPRWVVIDHYGKRISNLCQ